MSLFISEQDVADRLAMPATVAAVRQSFLRLADGLVHQAPRVQLMVSAGYFAAVCGADEGLGLATVKSYMVIDGQLRGFVITVSCLRDGEVKAVIEADLLTKIRTGAASGVAAAALARAGSETVGIIGCGGQAPFQLEAVRHVLPHLSAFAWCRRADQLASFCERTGAVPAESPREAASCDIVVTATTSPSPVVAGEWLREGALVIAIGGDYDDRELDDETIRRSALITCDSITTSREEAADIWEPASRKLISWGDVVELQDIVAGRHPGRTSNDDIILFKSNGLGAWDVAAAAVLLGRDANVRTGRRHGDLTGMTRIPAEL
jgi:alanine dehydrogenase